MSEPIPRTSTKHPRSHVAIVIFILAAVTSVGIYAFIKWQQSTETKRTIVISTASAPTASSAPSEPSHVPPIVTLSPVASTTAAPPPTVILTKKEELSDKERATLKAAEAQVTSGGQCYPMTKRDLMGITEKWKNFPDAYCLLAKCSRQLGVKDSEAYYDDRCAKLTGGNTGPP
jgi:hypothetical protein